MQTTTEADIEQLVRGDGAMMRALRIARELHLPDWWIGAGFLRNKVWDTMSELPDGYSVSDVDLVYYSKDDIAPETDWAYDERLNTQDPHNQWEVRNQARMHYVNDLPPFTSTEDGIAHWTETATAVGVRLIEEKLEFLFCYGSDDLLAMIARPTPYLVESGKTQIFRDRVEKKQWQKRWPALQVRER